MIFIDCKKASVYDLDRIFLCDASVHDPEENNVLLQFESPTADILRSEVYVTFYDSTFGLVTYFCTLSNYKEFLLAPGYRVSTTSCNLQKEMSVIQRRNDIKIHVEVETTLTFANEEDLLVQASAVVKDISAGGIFFTTKYPFSPGQVFSFSFSQSANPLILKAQVIRIQPPHEYDSRLPDDKNLYGYGCKFVDLSPHKESVIRNFVYKKDLELKRMREMMDAAEMNGTPEDTILTEGEMDNNTIY